MRWTNNSIHRVVIRCAGFFISAGISAAAIAEPMVIKYQGPAVQNYKPGKKFAANQIITLKSGEVLTILDERGTRTLRGPGSFSTSSAANSKNLTQTSLASLMKTSTSRRARTGAVRGTNSTQTAARSPNLWFVDITKSATICVADFSNLQLWRANSAQPLTVSTKSANNSGSVIFMKGQSTARWPSQVAPVDGGKYAISFPDVQSPVSITLVKMVVTGTEGLDNMASNLLSKGCQTQGELLADTFAQADPKPIGG